MASLRFCLKLIIVSTICLNIVRGDTQKHSYLRERKEYNNDKQQQRRLMLDPRTLENKAPPETKYNPRRKFVSYKSSEWETTWLLNVNQWASEEKLCDILVNYQSNYVHDFLNATCTYRYPPTSAGQHWCMIDDTYHPLYYNTANRDSFEMQWSNPVTTTSELQRRAEEIRHEAVRPTKDMEHIFSKFVFYDEIAGEEYVEYIEPLVSHLRFVLAGCAQGNINRENGDQFREIEFRGWVVPPPNSSRFGKKYYFDAGASDWTTGQGGPSLSYFYDIWSRHDIQFDQVYAFEIVRNPDDFYRSLPDPSYQNFVHFQQCAVKSSPDGHSAESPFLPFVIKETTNEDDYVLFKLDIDSPDVENGNIDFILNDPTNVIDEVVYEHHIGGNYIMGQFWGHHDEITLRESYEMFLRLRQKGIRAHSWV